MRGLTRLASQDFTPENGGTRILPFSHLGRIREGGREMGEETYDESQVLKVGMPRGSVLIFTGGMVHAGGQNTTDTKRKSVLTGYQLGWLRPENKFHACASQDLTQSLCLLCKCWSAGLDGG